MRPTLRVLVCSCARNFRACVADLSRGGIDTADMTGQDLARDRPARRQNDAGRKRLDSRGDRANNRQPRVGHKQRGRDNQRRASTGLLSAASRIEISPDQIAGVQDVVPRHKFSTISRPRSGSQSNAEAYSARHCFGDLPLNSSANSKDGAAWRITISPSRVSTSDRLAVAESGAFCILSGKPDCEALASFSDFCFWHAPP
jgi:hypothetical protein